MSLHVAKKEHKIVFNDLVALLSKHADKVSAEEFLAIAANILGKIIALQDQRTMSRERAIETVIQNIEYGNAEVMDEILK